MFCVIVQCWSGREIEEGGRWTLMAAMVIDSISGMYLQAFQHFSRRNVYISKKNKSLCIGMSTGNFGINSSVFNVPKDICFMRETSIWSGSKHILYHISLKKCSFWIYFSYTFFLKRIYFSYTLLKYLSPR